MRLPTYVYEENDSQLGKQMKMKNKIKVWSKWKRTQFSKKQTQGDIE